MSSLHENVSRRRAAESTDLSCCTLGSASALVVQLWTGPTWLLPWSYMMGGRLEDERLELFFTPCVVVCTGLHLRGLLPDLAGFRVAILRDLPATYRPAAGDGSPFIAKIEVRVTEPVPRLPG